MRKSLVFDLDDTLYPERQFAFSGFDMVGEWLKKNKAVAEFTALAKELYDADVRRNIFNVALEEKNIEADANLIKQLVEVYRSHSPCISLFDDARWALSTFQSQYAIGLITDGYLQTQRNKVDALGISNIFNKKIFTDEYGAEHWKPSPVPYRRMSDGLGCKGRECVYVGDNPRKDFVTARKLGWMTVQVCRTNGEYSMLDAPEDHQADIKVLSLKELAGVL